MSEGSRAGALLQRHGRAIGASLALLLAFAWILRAGALPLVPPARALANVESWGVAAMAALLLANILLRLGRYHFLVAPLATVSFGRVMSISCVALGLLTFLPFRLGEMARPAMLREKGKLSGWAVTGTVGAERIIDGVVFSAAMLLGLAFAEPLSPLPERIGDLPVHAALVPWAARIAALGFGGAFVVMGAFYFFRATARRVTARALGVFSQRLAERVSSVVERLSDGLRFLPDLAHSGMFLFATVAAHLVQAYGILLLAHACGVRELTFAEANVVLGVLGLGFALPNAPGFFGSFQLALYAGLAVYVAPLRVVNEGAVFVFLFYVIYVAEVILLSIAGVLAEALAPASESARGSEAPAALGTSGSEKAM